MEKKTVIGIICVSCVLLTYWACGLNDPKYVSYIEDTGPDTTLPPASACDTEALGLFTANVHAVLVVSCATPSCQGAVPIAGSPLSLSSASENKSIVTKYTGDAPQIFFKMLSNQGPETHTAGDLSNVLPIDPIKEWTDKEAECAAEG